MASLYDVAGGIRALLIALQGEVKMVSRRGAEDAKGELSER
jgi:hypothetical protein